MREPRPDREGSNRSGDAPDDRRRSRAVERLVQVDEIELSIEKLIAGGEGLGRFEGIPVFVPRSAPGDRLRVRIVERKPGYGRAEILEILAPGPGRREPLCRHFGRCGGCDLQHLEDALQLRLKSAAVVETVARISGLELPPPRAIYAGDSWAYRTRTQVHTKRVEGGGAAVGYHARASRELVVVEQCPVLVPALEREVVTLGRRLPPSVPNRIDLATGDDGTVSIAPLLEGLPHGELSRRIGGFEFGFDARSFFQGHASLTGTLMDVVVGDGEGGHAIDLYGGVGLFALPLARRYSRVTLVEGDRLATRHARRNLRTNRIENVDVVAQAVESWVPGGLPDGVDRVVVDPPRDGLSAPVRALLAGRAPRRLTYVSCHPAALGRDLEALDRSFEIASWALLDLFPQTGHMEVVVDLRRRAERS
ncbi:MAG: class I SAM-dependent RNA methyltransferase [Thermoanaerobaculia bacterium]